MPELNVTLTEKLKSFVDEQTDRGGYTSSSNYPQELIRRDKDRERLRDLLLDGADAKPKGEMDDAYFATLRERVAGSPS